MSTKRRLAGFALMTLSAATIAGCSTAKTQAASQAAAGTPIKIVAAENIWGDQALHVGGNHVTVRSIIDSPDADPHDYEPTPADGMDIASASLVIVNGVGYDSWATKLVQSNSLPADKVLDVGDVTSHKAGDNPHRWYSPTDVNTVIDALIADLSKIDAAHAGDYQANAEAYRNGDLARYTDAIATIKSRYAGTPIGASESVVSPMAEGLGLKMMTPASFLSAISEGAEPTIADKRTIDAQLKGKQIKVYVYNSQNATPDVNAQLALAKANSIPVVTFTETLTPAGSSFVDWQVAQLNALKAALATATGK